MPVLRFHLVQGRQSVDDVRALVEVCCRDYSQVLGSPMERVRAFVHQHDPSMTFVAGAFIDDRPADGAGEDLYAPFFEFIVLSGRPPEQRHHLLEAFTDHTVTHLGVRRDLVRGRAIEVEPADWGIAGVPAAVTRASEIEAREAAAR